MTSKKTNSAFFIIIFVLALVIHALGSIYPQYVNRVFAAFLPIPILIINYYNNVEKANALYMISFLFTYIGATIYILNLEYSFTVSLILYSIGIGIYIKLILEKISSINWLYFFLLLVGIMALPIYYLHNSFNIADLLAVLVYCATVILFFFVTANLNLKEKNKINILAIFSSIAYLMSTIASSVLIFKPKEALIDNIASITFWVSHLYMSLYMIKQSNSDDVFTE